MVAEIEDPLTQRKIDRLHLWMVHGRGQLLCVERAQVFVLRGEPVGIDASRLDATIPHVPIDASIC